MRSAPTIPAISTLSVRALPDPVIDAVGEDPRSPYVEQFWLGTLGPSTTWLLRHIANSLDEAPDGFDLSLEETARRLGLGDKGGRHSPFTRALTRLVQFDLAQLEGEATLAVRRKVPPLNRRQVGRLSEPLQEAHERWQQSKVRTPPIQQLRQRTRELAASYVAAGLGVAEAERELMRLGFHPALCGEAMRWITEQQGAS